MKNILPKAIQSIRLLLEKAEFSLEEKHKNNCDLVKNELSHACTKKEKTPYDTDILVPFSRTNSSGAPSTYKDRKTMNALLDEWIVVSGVDAKQAKSMLRKHAEVHRLDYMTVGQVDEACAWLRKNIAIHKHTS